VPDCCPTTSTLPVHGQPRHRRGLTCGAERSLWTTPGGPCRALPTAASERRRREWPALVDAEPAGRAPGRCPRATPNGRRSATRLRRRLAGAAGGDGFQRTARAIGRAARSQAAEQRLGKAHDRRHHSEHDKGGQEAQPERPDRHDSGSTGRSGCLGPGFCTDRGRDARHGVGHRCATFRRSGQRPGSRPSRTTRTAVWVSACTRPGPASRTTSGPAGGTTSGLAAEAPSQVGSKAACEIVAEGAGVTSNDASIA